MEAMRKEREQAAAAAAMNAMVTEPGDGEPKVSVTPFLYSS